MAQKSNNFKVSEMEYHEILKWRAHERELCLQGMGQRAAKREVSRLKALEAETRDAEWQSLGQRVVNTFNKIFGR